MVQVAIIGAGAKTGCDTIVARPMVAVRCATDRDMFVSFGHMQRNFIQTAVSGVAKLM